jgi:putative transposase
MDLENKKINKAHMSIGWSMPALRKRFNQDKEVVAPWWGENSKDAYASGLGDLADALAAWSASRRGLRKGARVGFPKYKKRGDRDSVRFSTGVLRVEDEHHVVLPRIGRLRTKEPMRELLKRLQAGDVRILSASAKQVAGRWHVSLICAAKLWIPNLPQRKLAAGVDVGLKHLAIIADSEGTIEYVENPRSLMKAQTALRRTQRILARREVDSKRREKAKQALARQHARVTRQRLDALHKLTHHLTHSYQSVVIEHLNVAGMMQNHHLARALSDASFGEIRRQLTYKMLWAGGELLEADVFFPSSKRCHKCGTVKAKLSLSDRVFRCENLECLWSGDRDENAARNLLALVTQSALGTLNARGLGVRPSRAGQSRKARNPWKKREAGSPSGHQTSSPTPQGVGVV